MTYRIAALTLGIIVAGYWWRVVRMAQKSRRRTGHGANFLPREPAARALRLAWVPIVIAWIGQPFIVALLPVPPAPLRPLYASPWLAWPCAIVALGAFQATRICWRTMGRNWRMGIDPAERTELVLAGPFAYVRHPIYALSQAIMLAVVVALPSPVMIAAGAMHIFLIQLQARREEAYLIGVHGQQYADYCARVRRFVPWTNVQPPDGSR